MIGFMVSCQNTVLYQFQMPLEEDFSKNIYIDPINITQCAERILNKISKPLNETFTGLMCILQGFRICFV